MDTKIGNLNTQFKILYGLIFDGISWIIEYYTAKEDYRRKKKEGNQTSSDSSLSSNENQNVIHDSLRMKNNDN